MKDTRREPFNCADKALLILMGVTSAALVIQVGTYLFL